MSHGHEDLGPIQRSAAPDEMRKATGDGTLYAVLDGENVAGHARAAGIQDPVSLFRGTPYDAAASIAPHALAVTPETFDWVIAWMGTQESGVYAASTAEPAQVIDHLLWIAFVQPPSGQPWLFRYFDPIALDRYIATCNGDDLADLLGPLDSFANLTEDGEVRLLERPAGLPLGAVSDPSSGHPPIREERLPLFEAQACDDFQAMLADHVRRTFPDKVGALDDAALNQRITWYLDRAAAIGLTDRKDIADFVEFAADQDDMAGPRSKELPEDAALSACRGAATGRQRGKSEAIARVGAEQVEALLQHHYGANPRAYLTSRRQDVLRRFAERAVTQAGLDMVWRFATSPRNAAEMAMRDQMRRNSAYQQMWAARHSAAQIQGRIQALRNQIETLQTRANHARRTLTDEVERRRAIEGRVSLVRGEISTLTDQLHTATGHMLRPGEWLAKRNHARYQMETAHLRLRTEMDELVRQNAVVTQAQLAVSNANFQLDSARGQLKGLRTNALARVNSALYGATQSALAATPLMSIPGPIGSYVHRYVRPPTIEGMAGNLGVGGGDVVADMPAADTAVAPEPVAYRRNVWLVGDGGTVDRLREPLDRIAVTPSGRALFARLAGAAKGVYVTVHGDPGYILIPKPPVGDSSPSDCVLLINLDDAAPSRSPESDLFEGLTLAGDRMTGEAKDPAGALMPAELAEVQRSSGILCGELIDAAETAALNLEAAGSADAGQATQAPGPGTEDAPAADRPAGPFADTGKVQAALSRWAARQISASPDLDAGVRV